MFAILQVGETLAALAVTLIFGLVAILLLGAGYIVFDRYLTPKIDVEEQLNRGNIAVAIIAAAFLMSLALIVYGVTN
jgi:putative membrane protein